MAQQQPLMLVGHDAELFVAKNGVLVAGCGLIGGSKKVPKPLPRSKYGVKYQEDGVTLEYNQSPVPAIIEGNPAHSPGDLFFKGYSEVVKFAKEQLGLEVLGPRPLEVFTAEALENPQARLLGCDPDFNAYEPGIKRIPPDINDMGNMRFAAGHLHFGYDKDKSGIPDWAMVRMLEALVYCRWMAYDVQKERRKFYGLAGLYRPKDYGVEWRTPSNFWLNHPGFVNDAATVANCIVKDPKRARSVYNRINFDEVQRAINSDKRDQHLNAINDRLYREILAI